MNDRAGAVSGLDPMVGPRLLSRLGFLQVPGRPQADGQAYLFVALRQRPTLDHFDPEHVDFWLNVGGHGTRISLDRSMSVRGDVRFAWGVVSVVDRKSIANEFVTFGGELSVRRVEDIVIVVFRSPAPIAASGGHSQGWDLGAEEMAAFMGRLRAAAGTSRELDFRLASLSPLAVYALFVIDSLGRHHSRHGLLVGDERIVRMLDAEQDWLRANDPGAWAAAREVAHRLR
jgi:hypothetical protein